MISAQTLLDDYGVALERWQHPLLGLRNMRLDQARGAAGVAPLHGLDHGDVLGHQSRRIVALQIGQADADQTVGLSDQIAQRMRRLPEACASAE